MKWYMENGSIYNAQLVDTLLTDALQKSCLTEVSYAHLQGITITQSHKEAENLSISWEETKSCAQYSLEAEKERTHERERKNFGVSERRRKNSWVSEREDKTFSILRAWFIADSLETFVSIFDWKTKKKKRSAYWIMPQVVEEGREAEQEVK